MEHSFDLVPDGVCMIWAGLLEEVFKVIGRLLRLTLEVVLSSSDVFFIKVLSLLIIVTLLAAGGNGDPLGVPLWAPLIGFGTSLYLFADGLRQCPSATNRGHLPLALDKNSPNCFLTRGASGHDVKKFFCDLRLITTEFVY
jgi:hypothetical protein